MKPIGTITQYFSFIDEQTKTVLENVMREATDYCDFVEKLDNMVINNDSPVMVVYFAIHFSMIGHNYKLIDKIREKYGHHLILGPNLFYSSVYQGTYRDAEKVHELADAVLKLQPEDWLALEMNLIKFEIDMRNYPETMYPTSLMNNIQELIASNPDFGFYEIVLCDYLAIRAQVDGDVNERIRSLERGIQIADKYDDQLRKANFLTLLGSIKMNFDRTESRKALEEAYQIVDSSLGIPSYFANILYYLSLLDSIKGEFDNAIEGCLEAVTIRERVGLEIGNAASFLSIFYNAIGEPESGLEWGQMAEDQFRGRPYLINYAIMSQVWSLILLKRLIEAQALIDSVRESIVKSGNEDHIAWLHFVTGIMEVEQGDFPLALSSIEEGIKIFEQKGTWLLLELIFLHQLAKVEILSSSTDEIVSPSLAVLEERAINEDLPGFLGLALLLKADVALLSNNDELLREIIPQLQLLSEKKGLEYLKPYFESLQNRL